MSSATEQSTLAKLPGKKQPPTLTLLRKEIASLADPDRAVGVARFFKTGKGEYGEGDKFLGIKVPDLHRVVRGARGISLEDSLKLLRSPWHEERVVAALLLVDAHDRGTPAEQRAIERAYLSNTKYINNWDLVDASAPELVGRRVEREGTQVIDRLAKSKSLWERRIAMVATHHTTRAGDFAPALRIAERLLDDAHDLMHKAVGWMLREVGKRSPDTLRDFLGKHAATMPRTALRYSIERFTPDERKRWLAARAETATTRARSATASSPRSRRPAATRR